jgi:hypothetical protein
VLRHADISYILSSTNASRRRQCAIFPLSICAIHLLLQAAYMIVDEMHEEHPELLKDQYWEEVVPKELPYTLASEHYRRTEPKCSAENFKVKEADSLYANLLPSRKSVPDDVYADYVSNGEGKVL